MKLNKTKAFCFGETSFLFRFMYINYSNEKNSPASKCRFQDYNVELTNVFKEPEPYCWRIA